MYQARDNGTFINELRSQSINLTVEEKKTKLMSLAIYFTSYILNMFRILIYPSSGAWDCAVELPHSACNTVTTQNQPYQISNTKRTENKTTDVVIQQHSPKLLMMDILISETCWVYKKWNKITSDIKLLLYSSTITMIHGPINIRLINLTFHKGKVTLERCLKIRENLQRSTFPNFAKICGLVLIICWLVSYT